MGDIGARVLILNPDGMGTRLLSSCSWSNNPDSQAISWLVGACNALVDFCLPLYWIYQCYSLFASIRVSLAVSLPPTSIFLGSFSTASVRCDRARIGALHQFMKSSFSGRNTCHCVITQISPKHAPGESP